MAVGYPYSRISFGLIDAKANSSVESTLFITSYAFKLKMMQDEK